MIAPHSTEGPTDGPHLFLVHGTATDGRNWFRLTRLLRGKFRVTTYDRRGTPGWPSSGKVVSVGDHVRDLYDLITSTTDGPVFAHGESFGGTIVLELCKMHPELLKRVALYEPAVSIDNQSQELTDFLVKEFEYWDSRGQRETAVDRFYRRLHSSDLPDSMSDGFKSLADEFGALIYSDLIAKSQYWIDYETLRRIDTPTLVLLGSRENNQVRTQMKNMEAAMQNAICKELSNAGHRISGAGWKYLADHLVEFFDV